MILLDKLLDKWSRHYMSEMVAKKKIKRQKK